MLGGASGANTGHFASFFYYTRERALLEGELAAQARKIKEKKKKVKFSGEKNKELKEKQVSISGEKNQPRMARWSTSCAKTGHRCFGKWIAVSTRLICISAIYLSTDNRHSRAICCLESGSYNKLVYQLNPGILCLDLNPGVAEEEEDATEALLALSRQAAPGQKVTRTRSCGPQSEKRL